METGWTMIKKSVEKCCLKRQKQFLGFFGFDRSMYGDPAKKKNRKWWHTVREDRSRDIENETF